MQASLLDTIAERCWNFEGLCHVRKMCRKMGEILWLDVVVCNGNLLPVAIVRPSVQEGTKSGPRRSRIRENLAGNSVLANPGRNNVN